MSNFYTVKEAAEKIGVSVQTIYNYVRNLEPTEIEKKGNVTVINSAAFEKIKEAITKNTQPQATESNDSGESIEAYKDYVKTLKEQLSTKDEQINELLQRLREGSAINYNLSLPEPKAEETEPLKREEEPIKEKASLKERLRFLFKGTID